jgi:sporulation protein YlmC with PRC-barrel domain
LAQWKRREEVIGKEVVDTDAKKVGVTKDLAWSSDGRIALIIESSEEEESFLSFDDIEKIGDVVFVKAKSSLMTAPSVTCPICRHKNLVEAKFCAKCGHPMGGKEKKRASSET